MTLKIEKRDGTPARRVLVGMVMSRSVVGPIAARWEPPGFFGSRAENLIASWSVEHYRKYGRAVGRGVVQYLDQWAPGRDRETVEMVERFLAGLSDEYDGLKRTVNPDHLLDVAARVFDTHRLRELKAGIEADLEVGEIEKARARVDASRKIEIGLGAGVDVFDDPAAMDAAFEQQTEPLVEYDHALKNFFGHVLSRDKFIAVLGAPKKGKSFSMFDIGWRAATQGKNVAYFEMGDQSQWQVLLRMAARGCGRPIAAGRYEWPLSIDSNGGKNEPTIHSEWRDAPSLLTREEANAAMAKEKKRVGGKKLRLSCHPAGSLSVAAAEEILNGWERDGWFCDVTIFDYADLAAPIDRKADKLEQTDQTWSALRALAQKKHCLVVTATQCNRSGFDSRLLGREHVGGYYMKIAHATGILAVNSDDDEKKKGLSRLNWIANRELTFGEEDVCWCVGNLGVAAPYVLSCF